MRNIALPISSTLPDDVGFSEIEIRDTRRFRIDYFLTNRARAIFEPDALPEFRASDMPEIENVTKIWFKGTAIGAFDGEIKAVDLRGNLPQLKLVLTAGSAEIDCIFNGEDREQIRVALDRRARVHGRAIYDGTSGLPQRVEVERIEIVPVGRDLMRWRGSFEPFEADTWEEEGE